MENKNKVIEFLSMIVCTAVSFTSPVRNKNQISTNLSYSPCSNCTYLSMTLKKFKLSMYGI